jgi:anti-sigma B factor antagonist
MSEKLLDIEMAEKGNLTTILLTGELDISMIPYFQEKLNPSFLAEKENLLFDFSGLKYIDSTGLRQFIYLIKLRAAGNKNIIKVKDASPKITRVFTVTGIHHFLELV